MARRIFKLTKSQAESFAVKYAEIDRIRRDISVMATTIIQANGFNPEIAALEGIEGQNMIVATIDPPPIRKQQGAKKK